MDSQRLYEIFRGSGLHDLGDFTAGVDNKNQLQTRVEEGSFEDGPKRPKDAHGARATEGTFCP